MDGGAEYNTCRGPELVEGAEEGGHDAEARAASRVVEAHCRSFLRGRGV